MFGSVRDRSDESDKFIDSPIWLSIKRVWLRFACMPDWVIYEADRACKLNFFKFCE